MDLSAIPEESQQRLRVLLQPWLPKELVDELIAHHTSVTYSKDSIIFLQGSPADLIFWVVTGLVKLYCPLSGGGRTLVRLAGPGDLLGHIDFVDADGRRSQAFEAHALTKCSIAIVTREQLNKLLQKLEPQQLIRLLEAVNTFWSSMAHWFALLLGISFRERLEITLDDLATKFGVRDTRGTLLVPELSHVDLAEMIGSSRPMVSRLVNEMIAEGALARRGKQYILLNRPNLVNGTLAHFNRAPYQGNSLWLGPSVLAASPPESRNQATRLRTANGS
jgi:CRP/FNR family transcriptional regulator, cyclic AMP receptor protein